MRSHFTPCALAAGWPLSVTDAASLRAAAGKVARAVGQSQLAVYRLQTADGAVGTAPAASAAATAYGTAIGNQVAGTSANTASAAVEKALTNQDTALNATGYSNSGSATNNLAQLQSFFSLFA